MRCGSLLRRRWFVQSTAVLKAPLLHVLFIVVADAVCTTGNVIADRGGSTNYCACTNYLPC
jgi:hypothetical protein